MGLNPPPSIYSAEFLEKNRAIPLLTLRAFLAYKKGENLPMRKLMAVHRGQQ